MKSNYYFLSSNTQGQNNKRPIGPHIVHPSKCATFLRNQPWQPSCFFFQIGPKITNLVEDLEILLPVKFRWIPFSGFRGEVENVSANQRPGRPSCFSNLPKNTNLVEDIEILPSVKFCWIPFSGFRKDVEYVSANQRPGRPSCFSDRPKKHKFGRGRWDAASCQVFVEFCSVVSEEMSKMSQPITGQGSHLVFRSARKTPW